MKEIVTVQSRGQTSSPVASTVAPSKRRRVRRKEGPLLASLATGEASPREQQNVSQPLTGIGAGEGYLVVPAGSRLTAWKLVGP